MSLMLGPDGRGFAGTRGRAVEGKDGGWGMEMPCLDPLCLSNEYLEMSVVFVSLGLFSTTMVPATACYYQRFPSA
jgi:hypothetical protein